MVKWRQSVRIGFTCALGMFAINALSAELFTSESFQIHGFASQAGITTTGNNFFGRTKDSVDFDFRELGINGSWRALPDLQLSLQVVARWAGETDDGDPRVDYGFVDYSFLSDADDLWGVRVGRVVYPYGFYNETRDVAFTRPTILLPQSIYFDKNRNLSLSSDGIQVYGERRTDMGDFILQLSGSLPRLTDPDSKLQISRGVSGELEGELTWLGRLLYEKNSGAIRLAITGGQLNADFEAANARSLGSGSWQFEPLILSAQYNAERWSLTGEYALRHFQLNYRPAFPDPDFTGESYYLQASYRFTPTLEGVLRYDSLTMDREDPDGQTWKAKTGRPSYTRFARDWTVGLRWDVSPSLMLRAEFHHINGTGWLSSLENFQGTEQYWNLFSVLASYRF